MKIKIKIEEIVIVIKIGLFKYVEYVGTFSDSINSKYYQPTVETYLSFDKIYYCLILLGNIILNSSIYFKNCNNLLEEIKYFKHYRICN
jgi:hypothetical protein